MLKTLGPVLALAIGIACSAPAQSRERVRWRIVDPLQELVMPRELLPDFQPIDRTPDDYELALDQSQVSVAPSEAAAIARDMVPGAKVVGVKLLPNGYYAVTLRSKGSVTRILVSAIDGSVR